MLPIKIYTDGSCHTQLRIGGWAAIVFIGEEKVILKEIVCDTTHNRMELMAVIRAIEYVRKLDATCEAIQVLTDSQYVEKLLERGPKLRKQEFLTRTGNPLPNADLVRKFLDLGEMMEIEFIKVKAHQKADASDNFNREVDKIVRKMLREAVKLTGGSVKD